MVSGVADEQNREQRAGKRVSDAEINRHRSQSVQGCEIPSEERRRPDRDITGEFIQSDSKTSQFRPDHAADSRVDDVKQCEWLPIGFEAKRDLASRRCVLRLRGGHPATAAMPVHKWSACRSVSTT